MTDQFTISNIFLDSTAELTPRDAVAAFILDENKRVLLQLRDDKTEIFFPNHWGCFGGAIEAHESIETSLVRELEEEIGITIAPHAIEKFIQISFNARVEAKQKVERYFFLVHTTAREMQNITLGEGSAWRFFTPREAMAIPNMTPYDRFALWLYYNQHRILDVA